MTRQRLTLVLVLALAASAVTGVAATPTAPAADGTSAAAPMAPAHIGDPADRDRRGSGGSGLSTGDVPHPSPPDIDSDNPYGKEQLVVSSTYDGVEEGKHNAEIQAALRFWERDSEQYAGYDVDYVYHPDATDPDVELTFVSSMSMCGYTWDPETLGCAPVVTEEWQTSGTIEIEIEDGWDSSSTELIVKHELGHTLGLTHDDDPYRVMKGTIDVTEAARVNSSSTPIAIPDNFAKPLR